MITLHNGPWLIGWLGIQSLDTWLVNSVHCKHWLETSVVERTVEGRRAFADWELKNMDFLLESVWKSRNTVNKLLFLMIFQQDSKGRNCVSSVKMEFPL